MSDQLTRDEAYFGSVVANRKREPVAVTLAEGGVLVKHTDDVDLADRLARELLITDQDIDRDELTEQEYAGLLPTGRPIWCRILGRLPGSLAEAEGWAWEYRHVSGPGRGVFQAVEYVR